MNFRNHIQKSLFRCAKGRAWNNIIEILGNFLLGHVNYRHLFNYLLSYIRKHLRNDLTWKTLATRFWEIWHLFEVFCVFYFSTICLEVPASPYLRNPAIVSHCYWLMCVVSLRFPRTEKWFWALLLYLSLVSEDPF